MEVVVGVWSAVIEPKKKLELVPPANIRLTNVALGDSLQDSTARTTLKLTHDQPAPVEDDDEEADSEDLTMKKTTTVLCSLSGGKIEQTTVNLFLEEQEDYVLESVGPNTLYLTGNYVKLEDGEDRDLPPFGDSDDEIDVEGAYRLEDVSSDVEMDAGEVVDDDDERFEEIDEAVHGNANGKRPRESDGVAEASKKQKNEAGDAVKKDKKDKKKDKKKEAGKGDDTPKKADDKPKKAEEPKKAEGAEREITGGIKIRDPKVGTGPAAKKGNTVSMRYIGKLNTIKGKIFDQNTKGKPFTFNLGKNEVIKGWDEGIVGMQVGGERVLTIPAPMGYGKRGTDGIPPNSTLVFEVKLINIK
ncbi:Peptidylprolyl isomerase [Mycena chlorophos]|uniref:FK506-binding protein n=1 Tax=Mycena chlorophos TaxID=658473 RepID=A0A8H6W920_MYCCL|nr:Peptidylprolyl isomerase [Mycena chlorophos]